MTKCSVCKKKYNTYPVFLVSRDECLAMEFAIRDIYYDDWRDMGLCEECRKKVWEDKVGIWRLWLLARCSIEVLRAKYIRDNNIKRIKDVEAALKRIDEKDAELEKLPEVKKVLEENLKSKSDDGSDF